MLLYSLDMCGVLGFECNDWLREESNQAVLCALPGLYIGIGIISLEHCIAECDPSRLVRLCISIVNNK